MNNSLKPVFDILLPQIEEAKINYWVYGGVAVATLANRFVRENHDIDIFVKEEELEKVKSILEKICNSNGNMRLKLCKPLKKGLHERPKFEVKIGGVERLSVVPVFIKGDIATLVFGNGAKDFAKGILKEIERNLAGFKFFTPPDEYIREIFVHCFRHKRNWQTREDVRIDARIVLSSEEFEKYFPRK